MVYVLWCLLIFSRLYSENDIYYWSLHATWGKNSSSSKKEQKQNFNVLASFQHSYYDIVMKMLFWRYFDRELILESAISSIVARLFKALNRKRYTFSRFFRSFSQFRLSFQVVLPISFTGCQREILVTPTYTYLCNILESALEQIPLSSPWDWNQNMSVHFIRKSYFMMDVVLCLFRYFRKLRFNSWIEYQI